MKKIKIALFSGGVSREREISLKTGEQIYKALDKNKYQISRYDPKKDLKKFIIDNSINKFDLAIPALHGPYGEDGKIQGLLDLLDVQYLFSSCLSSALAMNKYLTKVIVKNFGVPVAKDFLIYKNQRLNLNNIIAELCFPIVIKPVELGSSVGISIAKNKKELQKGINEGFKYGKELLLEKYIKGRELTIPIMGNINPQPMPIIEIVPKVSKWFDYKAKYVNGGSEEICPAPIDRKMKIRIEKLALIVYEALGCKDLARADFILEKGSGKLFFLEINTIPGMTTASLTPKSASEAGMDFCQFIEKLVSSSLSLK